MPRSLSLKEKDYYSYITDRGGPSSHSLWGFEATYNQEPEFFIYYDAYLLSTYHFNKRTLDLNNQEHVDLLCFCADKIFNYDQSQWHTLEVSEQIKIMQLMDLYYQKEKAPSSTSSDIKLALNAGAAAVTFASGPGTIFSNLVLGL